MTARGAPVAQQARSRQTQAQILDAACTLIANGGIDVLTLDAVAEVSVGSVYPRFGDKDTLLLSVQQAFANLVRDDVARRLQSHPGEAAPAVMIAQAVDAMTGLFRAHESVLEVFLVLGLQNADVHAAGSRASRDSKVSIEEYLQDVAVRWPDRRVALDFAFRLIYGVLAHRVTQGEYLESDQPLPCGDLQRSLTDAVTSYLLVDA